VIHNWFVICMLIRQPGAWAWPMILLSWVQIDALRTV
jgi:hypothetical protein